MHHQIEENKCVLWKEMEKLGSRKMSPEAAGRLAVYRDAYKALHMLCEEDMKPTGHGVQIGRASCRERVSSPV